MHTSSKYQECGMPVLQSMTVKIQFKNQAERLIIDHMYNLVFCVSLSIL